MHKNTLDLTNKRFERLLVIKPTKDRRKGLVIWECLCDCGNLCYIVSADLIHGSTRSCGCLRFGSIVRNNTKCFLNKKSWIKYTIDKARYRLKNTTLEFTLTLEQWEDLVQKECVYCLSKPNRPYLTKEDGIIYLNGIDRVDNTQGYTPENCVPCCTICNRAKNGMPEVEFKEYVKQTVRNHILKMSDQELQELLLLRSQNKALV